MKKETKIKMFLKKTVKVIVVAFASISTLALVVFAVLNLPVSLPDEKPNMGVTFSNRYAKDIDLDWKEVYIAMLDDLKVKKVRIVAYWDWIEKEDGIYDFEDLDWQVKEAEKRDVELVLAVGQKVPRWPECYVPKWIANDVLNMTTVEDQKRREKLPLFVEETVKRYKDSKAVAIWQIENEPFLEFGVCPKLDKDLLDEEIAVARKADPNTPIMLTDSGELSFWVPAAKRGDYFGTTMYREVITEKYGSWVYPIGPNFFKIKKALVRVIANQKHVAVIELQGEPWLRGWTTNFPIEEQLVSMNAEKLKKNIEFARKTGIKDIYVWGVEWWYYVKVKHNNSSVWDMAKELYK